MDLLADTNVLLRMLQRQHPDHTLAADAVRALWRKNHQVAIVPQVLYEYWVAATRPTDQNGFGLDWEEAEKHVDQAVRSFASTGTNEVYSTSGGTSSCDSRWMESEPTMRA